MVEGESLVAPLVEYALGRAAGAGGAQYSPVLVPRWLVVSSSPQMVRGHGIGSAATAAAIILFVSRVCPSSRLGHASRNPPVSELPLGQRGGGQLDAHFRAALVLVRGGELLWRNPHLRPYAAKGAAVVPPPALDAVCRGTGALDMVV